MENIKLYGIGIFVIILLIWSSNMSYQSYVINNMIGGFWDADTSFCEESGLDMFCIYFDNETSFGERACYILAKNGNDIVINEPTTSNISMQWGKLNNWSSDLKSPKFINIKFKDLSDECKEDFPEHQQMRFYPLSNKIVLFYDDTITAVLYKNTVTSELDALIKEKN